MKRSLIVRIVAIVLCALMVLSVVTIAITAFAADASLLAAPPDTGSDNIYIWVIGAVVVAIVAIAVCLVIPKSKK
jgi:hypothetical protein